MAETSIEGRIKSVLIGVLDEEVAPETITNDMPLIGSGLGLDSVMILQLIFSIEQEFQLSMDDEAINPELFRDINTLARYIRGMLGDKAEADEMIRRK